MPIWVLRDITGCCRLPIRWTHEATGGTESRRHDLHLTQTWRVGVPCSMDNIYYRLLSWWNATMDDPFDPRDSKDVCGRRYWRYMRSKRRLHTLSWRI